jgi:DNA polymerase
MSSFQLSIFDNQENKKSNSNQEWEDLKKECLNCTKCRLHETRTNVVFMDGNINAPIIVIGEGPGEHEDKSGIPFVGRAGQLLDKIFESVKLKRQEDLLIINVVKCRPPNNRAPFEDEINSCFGYLKRQIELSKAKIILLTGATALKTILNINVGISKIRGKWFEWEDKMVMPIFHPSYLLRNPSKEIGSPKWLTWQDFKNIKLKYDELKSK